MRMTVLFALAILAGLAAPLPLRAAAPASRPATQPVDPNWCTHVTHAPQQPKPNQAVHVTATIAPSFTNITLQYQLVDPGAYIELKDPAYAKNWIALPMHAAGNAWTADLPANLQTHRRLIRFRIMATAAGGQSVTAPGVASNFAYFVYDDLPAWTGAIEPKSAAAKRAEPAVFPAEVFGRVQPYHLLGKKTSIENVTWKEQTGGKEYKYTGTLVVNGVVHDHVRYRARGGSWRYAMGKNMWKFEMPEGDHLRATDDFGRAFPAGWSKVNLRPCISMGDYGRRGEQGMYESVGFRLFNLAGVPACNTAWVQLRIIDEAEESPADQYTGDFWGLYLAIENEDGRFLKAHKLPDGNLYKMQGGSGELNHHGDGQPADRSDLDAFINGYNAGNTTIDWWRAHLDLASYYSYRAIVECIHHYDIGEGKNYDYYHDPKSGKWQVIPWDLDLTWADHMYGNGEEPFKSRVLWRKPLQVEYQNRLREIRDLLFNAEQTGQLIDEYAAIIYPPGAPLTIAEADRRKWDYHPAMAMGGQSGQGRFYQAAATHDFHGMVEQMKAYVKTRGAWVDENLLNDPKIPATPIATYTGDKDHSTKSLRFTASTYKGSNPFAAIQWRLAEITAKGAAGPNKYEITPAWQSEELAQPDALMIPADAAQPGHTYRVRVRMKDATGRWSHWSTPVEFIAAR
ncbi:MAG: hypothetical protein JWN40_1438 [Phycisphaerales bacterium]|nr:hypothetical protein [Phycisphaerales bacterium]